MIGRLDPFSPAIPLARVGAVAKIVRDGRAPTSRPTGASRPRAATLAAADPEQTASSVTQCALSGLRLGG